MAHFREHLEVFIDNYLCTIGLCTIEERVTKTIESQHTCGQFQSVAKLWPILDTTPRSNFLVVEPINYDLLHIVIIIGTTIVKEYP